MFLGSKVQLVRRADNLTIIYELIVYTMWDLQHLTPYRPPRPVKGIALLYGDGVYFL
jgi:hypothetical protein